MAIIVGLPLSLDGSVGKAARKVNAFCSRLRNLTQLPVIVWDERMTTLEFKFSNELPIYLKDLLSTLPASRASIGKYVIGQRFINYKDWRDPLTSIA